MTIAVLPDLAPSRSTRMTASHRIRAIRFGGGHTSYIREGPQRPDTEWAVVWSALDAADAGKLDDFFTRQRGVEAFLWTPPKASSAQRFLCLEWQLTPISADHFRLDARFVRLYQQ